MPILNIAQAKKRFIEIADFCELSEPVRKEWLDYLDNLTTLPFSDELISLVETNQESMKRLKELMNNANQKLAREFEAQEKPLIILHPTDPTMLRVYENVIISATSLEELNNLTILDMGNVFKGFYAGYNKDMSGDIPGANQKWEPKERGLKRLHAYVDMPTARALSRYTNFEQKYPAASNPTIRDFAAKIDEERKPMELTFAEKPEDFCIMYGSGPSSCMTANGGNGNNFKWMWERNFCPASLYAYFPYTKGAYIIKNGRVIARTILFKQPDNTWQYGRIFCDSALVSKFKDTLAASGYKEMPHRSGEHALFKVPEDTKFTIPGYDYKKNGVKCMPWPYFDNMDYYGKGFYASYNKKTNEFTITYGIKRKDEDSLPIQIQDGVLLSTDYSERRCGYCEKVHKDRGYPWIVANDGECFDSMECMIAQGYVKVRTVQAEGYQLPDDTLIPIQGLKGTVFFSTLEAARGKGFIPLLNEDGSVPEEGDIQVTNKYIGVKDIGGIPWALQKELPENPKLEIIRATPIRTVYLDISEEEHQAVTFTGELPFEDNGFRPAAAHM